MVDRGGTPTSMTSLRYIEAIAIRSWQRRNAWPLEVGSTHVPPLPFSGLSGWRIDSSGRGPPHGPRQMLRQECSTPELAVRRQGCSGLRVQFILHSLRRVEGILRVVEVLKRPADPAIGRKQVDPPLGPERIVLDEGLHRRRCRFADVKASLGLGA